MQVGRAYQQQRRSAPTRRVAPHRTTAMLGVAIGLVGLTGAALAGALARRDNARIDPKVLGGQVAPPAPAAVLVRQGSEQATQLLNGLVKLAGQRVTLNHEVELVPGQADAGRSVPIWFNCTDKISESTCEHGAIAFASTDPVPALVDGRVRVVGDFVVAVLDAQRPGAGVVLTRAPS